MNVIQSLQPNTYRALGSVWILALIIFTVIAYRKLGFETEFGILQSLLVMILVFLIFKSRVTEQYSIYLLALSVVDVTVWSPSRKKLLSAITGVTLVYLLSNNYFLIRFLSPLSPSYLQLESLLSQQIGPYRLLANLCIGSAFTFLNVIYLILILKDKHERIGTTESKKLV